MAIDYQLSKQYAIGISKIMHEESNTYPFFMGSFTYYVITEGEGGSSMITLHVIVTWVSTVKVITEGRG